MKKVLLGIFLAITLSTFTACQKSDNNAGNNNVGSEDTTQGVTTEDNDTQEDDSQSSTDSTLTGGAVDNSNNSDMNNDTENNNSTDTQDTTGNETKSELLSIIQQIYDIKTPDLALGDIPVDVTNLDSVKYYTGLTDVSQVKDIAVSEAMIGSQAYSLVLVQLNQTKDAESVANEILKGIDQRKWICVEADDLQVVAQDDVIMLFMVSSQLKDVVTSQQIVDAFKEVRGGELNIELTK